MILYIVLAVLPLCAFAKLELVGSAWEVFPERDEFLNDDQDISNSKLGNLGDSVLETHLISSRGFMSPSRKVRSPTYHVMESSGLRSHFHLDYPVEEEAKLTNAVNIASKKLSKRSIESMESHDDNKKTETINSNEESGEENNQKHEKYTNFEESKNESGESIKVLQSAREARGATKEQWIKQPYPVDFGSRKDPSNNNINNDDQHTSETNNNNNLNVRAPNVHFVTQKRLDQAESHPEPSPRLPPPPPRSYESRKDFSRARNLDSYDYRNDVRRRNYDVPRRDYSRESYGRSRDYNRFDTDVNSYNREDDFDIYGRGPSQKKQRRIIYYANLPDLNRTPPNVDLRARYRYPDSEPNEYVRHDRRYDDGYVTSPTVSVADNDAYAQDRRIDVPPTYIPNYYRRYPPLPYSQVQTGRRRLDSVGSSSDRVLDRAGDRTLSSRNDPYPSKISTTVATSEGRKNFDRNVYLDRPRDYAFSSPDRFGDPSDSRFYRRL